VTDNNGFQSADTVKVVVANQYKINQYIIVYPNPAVDVVNVRYIFAKKGSMIARIYNAQGNVVKQQVFMKQDGLIDLSINIAALLPGPYFLELKFADGKTATRRFIKR